MSPIVLSQTGVGRSPVAALDFFREYFNVGLYAVVTATPTYNIEITPQDPSDGAPTVWMSPGGLTGLTANALNDLLTVAKGISINITAGPGSVTLYVVQAGTR
jgi:hypothetical protein